jgi:hypothetical protein
MKSDKSQSGINCFSFDRSSSSHQRYQKVNRKLRLKQSTDIKMVALKQEKDCREVEMLPRESA